VFCILNPHFFPFFFISILCRAIHVELPLTILPATSLSSASIQTLSSLPSIYYSEEKSAFLATGGLKATTPAEKMVASHNSGNYVKGVTSLG